MSMWSRITNPTPLRHVIETEHAKPLPTAPKLEQLKYIIEFLENALFDLEKNATEKSEKPGPPSGLALDDDELFVAWRESDSLAKYKQKIFLLIEKLLVKEEIEERKSDVRRYEVQGAGWYTLEFPVSTSNECAFKQK
ncbi:hypothetical protein BGX27_005693 [Mortierella sp. AM989]|nr:hypothetical protein BGX27_005693 [Mortierella sp. AM989]